MSIELVIGIVAFIIAVAAIAVAVYATGAFEYLGGKRAGPSPQPKDKLLAGCWRSIARDCRTRRGAASPPISSSNGKSSMPTGMTFYPGSG